MKVWYFDNQDCSGVFSSKENALASFHAGAKRCGWKVVAIDDNRTWVTITYAYSPLDEEWKIGTADILMYVLDEDHFG